jgi:hypothetical protein
LRRVVEHCCERCQPPSCCYCVRVRLTLRRFAPAL